MRPPFAMLDTMNTLAQLPRWFLVFALVLAGGVLGCDAERATRSNGDTGATPSSTPNAGQKEKPAATAKAPEESAPPKEGPSEEPPLPAGAKRGHLGKNVWLESEGKRRRVIVGAVVCLREGQWGLECLLCKKNTKEHESLLSMDADARTIHTSLTAA